MNVRTSVPGPHAGNRQFFERRARSLLVQRLRGKYDDFPRGFFVRFVAVGI